MRPTTAILCVATAGVIATYGYEANCTLCVLTGHAGPKLVLSTAEVDLGSVAADNAATVRVPIRNAGHERLVVHREGTGCCGSEAEPPVIVPPGERGELVATLDTAGRQGTVRQAIGYTTSDPTMPRFDLVLTADVGGE